MITRWNLWEVGKVGENPNVWILNTESNISDITAPGFIGNQPLSPGDLVFASYKDGSATVSAVLSAQDSVDGIVLIDLSAGTGSVTGASNLPGGQGIFSALVGSDLQFKSLIAGSGITLTPSSDNITIAAPASSSFEYQQTIFVAKNGNDSNSGKNASEPKLTVNSALSALPSGGVINILDNGTYTGAWVIPSGQDITINAPAAYLSTSNVTLSGGSIFKATSFSFGTNFNDIISSQSCTVFINAQKVRGNFGNGVTNPAQLFINAQETTGDYTFTTGTTTVIFTQSLSGDIVDTSPAGGSGIGTIGFFARNQTGNITSVNNNIYGFLLFSSGTPTISGINHGYFFGEYYLNEVNINLTQAGSSSNYGYIWGQKYQVIYTTPSSGSWSYVAGGPINANALVLITNNNGTFTLPPGDQVVPGYRMYSANTNASGSASVQVNPSTSDTMVGPGFGGTTSANIPKGIQEYLCGGDNGAGGVVWVCTGCS